MGVDKIRVPWNLNSKLNVIILSDSWEEIINEDINKDFSCFPPYSPISFWGQRRVLGKPSKYLFIWKSLFFSFVKFSIDNNRNIEIHLKIESLQEFIRFLHYEDLPLTENFLSWAWAPAGGEAGKASPPPQNKKNCCRKMVLFSWAV